MITQSKYLSEDEKDVLIKNCDKLVLAIFSVRNRNSWFIIKNFDGVAEEIFGNAEIGRNKLSCLFLLLGFKTKVEKNFSLREWVTENFYSLPDSLKMVMGTIDILGFSKDDIFAEDETVLNPISYTQILEKYECICDLKKSLQEKEEEYRGFYLQAKPNILKEMFIEAVNLFKLRFSEEEYTFVIKNAEKFGELISTEATNGEICINDVSNNPLLLDIYPVDVMTNLYNLLVRMGFEQITKEKNKDHEIIKDIAFRIPDEMKSIVRELRNLEFK